MKHSVEESNAVYDVLVGMAGARDSQRQEFMRYATEDIQWGHEFRFGGSLGSGGKVKNYGHGWYVTCYGEDRTPARDEVIAAVNARFKELPLTSDPYASAQQTR